MFFGGWVPYRRGGRVAAHWTVVPMVTGSNPCEGKGLFPVPRASLSHPAPNGYLTLHVVRRLGNAWNPQSRGVCIDKTRQDKRYKKINIFSSLIYKDVPSMQKIIASTDHDR